MFGKSDNNFLARDFVRGMKLQGMPDEDILDVMEKAGMPNEMAVAMLSRVTESIELQGAKDKKTVIRAEMESALWETNRNLQIEIKALADKLDYLQVYWESQIETLRSRIDDANTSIKGFEIYAKEIIKFLKKQD